MSKDARIRRRPRELSGRMVLFSIVGFFAVVGAVNAVMVYAATSTFGGLETQSSYKAGLTFAREQASVEAQDALHWDVSAHVARKGDGAAELDLAVQQPNGTPPAGLTAKAKLAHPNDARRDRSFEMTARGGGRFVGMTDADAGQWDLEIDLARGDERVFRSRSRIILK